MTAPRGHHTTGPNDSALDLDAAALYVNRELSLLAFQQRVLDEARDHRNPLLERLKFLAILGSNLDEFFMVRVSGIRRKVEAGVQGPSPDGVTPAQELAAIRERAAVLHADAARLLDHKLAPKLKKHGVHVLDYGQLSAPQQVRADAGFREVVYPQLAALLVDHRHPIPHLANLSLNLAVTLRDRDGADRVAWLGVPEALPRLFHLGRSPKGGHKDKAPSRHERFVWLEQLIMANLDPLFPGFEVISAYPFRVVRDADIGLHELEADDLMEALPRDVGERRFGSVIQVAIGPDMPEAVRALLRRDLDVDAAEMLEMPGPLGLSALWQVINGVDRPHLKYPPYRPFVPRAFRSGPGADGIFAAIRAGDILLHHPYDSFDPVVDFLEAAARDPQVLAIKQTLYRVGSRSPVVGALLEAAARGKQVSVLVELHARFEEESNISWSRQLEEQGAHLVYGVAGLKTHSKIALVVRREDDGIRRYLHLATGNYNATTARMYEDIGLFTCDEDLGADAIDLFDFLTDVSDRQASGGPEYRKLVVAPAALRHRLCALIERETVHAAAGREAGIILKINSLVDPRMIRQLYRASQAGVRIELLVRGICCLRPGIAGVSDNIRVSSLVGRYLEHSRIFHFRNGGAEEVYLGSADLMQRNLDRRVEVVFPVEDPAHIRYLRDQVLEACLRDDYRVREMLPDGGYCRPERGAEADLLSAQDHLMAIRYAGGRPSERGLRGKSLAC